jgi:cell wall-associated NlpC family hydrolase
MGDTGTSLAIGGFGVVLVWSAIHGASITATIRDIIRGKKPSGVDIYPKTAGTTGATVTGATGSAIANDALHYVGDEYVWGASGPYEFDCSGLVNWCLGHDLGLPIPGSNSGACSGHGPVTGQYMVWSVAPTVPASQIQAGDLVVWPTHMGIAISNTEMVSALNPSLGVAVTTIAEAAPTGEGSLMIVRRLGA